MMTKEHKHKHKEGEHCTECEHGATCDMEAFLKDPAKVTALMATCSDSLASCMMCCDMSMQKDLECARVCPHASPHFLRVLSASFLLFHRLASSATR